MLKSIILLQTIQPQTFWKLKNYDTKRKWYFFSASSIVNEIFRMSILTQFITLHASLKMFIFKYRKVISITFQQIQPARQFGQMKGFELTDLFLEGSFYQTLILDKRPCLCKSISVPFPLYLFICFFKIFSQIDYDSSHISTRSFFFCVVSFVYSSSFSKLLDPSWQSYWTYWTWTSTLG